jgi:hypothetical protein
MRIEENELGFYRIIEVTPEDSRWLRSLPYQQFLDTTYWRAVSQSVKMRAGHRCEKCGRPGPELETHHRSYRHHGREHKHLNDLVAWCNDCHRARHLSEYEGKPRPYKRRKIHSGPRTHFRWNGGPVNRHKRHAKL